MVHHAKSRKGKKKKSKPVGGNNVLPTSGPVVAPASSGGSVLNRKQEENCSSGGGGLQQSTSREYDSGHNREGAVIRSLSVKRALNSGVFLEAMDAKMLKKFMMEEWGGTGKRKV